MRIGAPLSEQLQDLEAWMREWAQEYHDSPPAPEMWALLVEGLEERADALLRYVTPKVIRAEQGERITPARRPMLPQNIEFVPQ